MTQKELDALLFLLEDPDSEVYTAVSEKIISLGTEVIPALEQTWESDFDALQQERIEHLIHQIQFKSVKKSFTAWKSNPNRSITEAMYFVNQFQYPTLDIGQIQKKIKLIVKDVWLELNNDLTPLEQINVFNKIFYKIYFFKCVEYRDLKKQHYYINNLIESKTGSNILLGLLYQTIAVQLNIPVYGICLPDLFLLGRVSKIMKDVPEEDYEKAPILFYIDPRKGTVFSKREITQYLQRLGIPKENRFYCLSKNNEIISRYLNELATLLDMSGDNSKLQEIWQLLDILKA